MGMRKYSVIEPVRTQFTISLPLSRAKRILFPLFTSVFISDLSLFAKLNAQRAGVIKPAIESNWYVLLSITNDVLALLLIAIEKIACGFYIID